MIYDSWFRGFIIHNDHFESSSFLRFESCVQAAADSLYEAFGFATPSDSESGWVSWQDVTRKDEFGQSISLRLYLDTGYWIVGCRYKQYVQSSSIIINVCCKYDLNQNYDM